jgi:hypothetical protein
MAEKVVSKPIPAKKTPVEPAAPGVAPKQFVPVWIIFLVLFLVSLAVGMGIYIGFQKGLFQKKTSTGQTETPTPSVSTASQNRIVAGSDWLTFRDEKAGFTLKYPPTVHMNEWPDEGSTQSTLGVSVEKIDDIPEEMPLGQDRKTALADREALLQGKAQTIGDFAASDALVRIGSTYNGRMTSVLSRFEICSIIFSRSLVYYPNNYQVTISLSGDEEQITKDMPEFFKIDPTNCGEMTMWNRDIMGTFMPTLAEGKGKGAGQLWYDTFDAIIKTITLLPVSANALPTATTAVTPAPTIASCEVSDAAFCNVLSDIKNSMVAKNYNGVIAYQTITSVTCDPDGMAISVCDGMAKGVVKEGYDMGYNESEGGVQTRDQHLASLASYVANNGPFMYKGSLQSGDKGIIEYLNGDASKLFVLYMKRTGATWRFQTILVGGTWGDNEFINLSPLLLDRVQ